MIGIVGQSPIEENAFFNIFVILNRKKEESVYELNGYNYDFGEGIPIWKINQIMHGDPKEDEENLEPSWYHFADHYECVEEIRGRYSYFSIDDNTKTVKFLTEEEYRNLNKF